MNKLSRRLLNPLEFGKSLLEYVTDEEFPTDDPRKREFAKSAKEIVSCQVVSRRGAFNKTWSQTDFSALTLTDAERLLTDLSPVLEDFPADKKLAWLQKYCESVTRRYTENRDSRLMMRITDIASRKTMRLQFAAIIRENTAVKRYYFENLNELTPTSIGGKINGIRIAKYYAGADDAELESTGSLHIRDLSTIRNQVKAAVSRGSDPLQRFEWESPQFRVREIMLEVVHGPGRTSWEDACWTIIEAVETEPYLDPILRLQLLKQIVPVAIDGSYILEQRVGLFREIVNEHLQDANINYLDPANTDASKVRADAQQIVNRMRVDGRRQGIEKDMSWLRQLDLGPTYSIAGWLYRESDNDKWTCAIGVDQSRTTSELFVVSHRNSDLTSRVVGRLVNGKPTLSEKSPLLLEGRIVFIRVRPERRRST